MTKSLEKSLGFPGPHRLPADRTLSQAYRRKTLSSRFSIAPVDGLGLVLLRSPARLVLRDGEDKGFSEHELYL